MVADVDQFEQSYRPVETSLAHAGCATEKT